MNILGMPNLVYLLFVFLLYTVWKIPSIHQGIPLYIPYSGAVKATSQLHKFHWRLECLLGECLPWVFQWDHYYYSTISDSDLDVIISEIQQYPMSGHLLSQGYRIQQACLRDSQQRNNSSGTALCRLNVLNSRQYSVPSPLFLYDIDGHHKLIR